MLARHCAWVGLLIAAVAHGQTPPAELTIEQVRAALLEEIQPVTLSNCELQRFGTTNDGDYLLCGNLSQEIESAYSYGVGSDDTYGCDVSTRYEVPVHQYDCFDPARPTCTGGNFVFHDECIGPKRLEEGGRVFDTLQNQIARNGDAGKRIIVKIDTEGAEWDSLLAAPDEVLDRIDQMPIEFHKVESPKTLELVRRLKTKFYPVALHFNNNACGTDAAPLPAWAFQVLWVNKRIGKLDKKAPFPAPASALDTPDHPGLPDCQWVAPTPEPEKSRRAKREKRRQPQG